MTLEPRPKENIRRVWARFSRNFLAHLWFWTVVLVLGIVAGGAAVGFRLTVSKIQTWVYGIDGRGLASHAMDLHWGLILAAPIIGGLLVGLILHRS